MIIRPKYSVTRVAECLKATFRRKAVMLLDRFSNHLCKWLARPPHVKIPVTGAAVLMLPLIALYCALHILATVRFVYSIYSRFQFPQSEKNSTATTRTTTTARKVLAMWKNRKQEQTPEQLKQQTPEQLKHLTCSSIHCIQPHALKGKETKQTRAPDLMSNLFDHFD